MTYALPACSFLLSIGSLYLAWRMYRGASDGTPGATKRWSTS